METRAPYVVIGSFVVAVIFAVFGFVYWLHNTGGLGQRAVYRVRFDQPVAGLTAGSAVLFNGVRIGEVTDLRIEPERPQGVTVSVAVDASAPVRSDTIVDVDYQGLTGVAAIALRGGSASAPPLAPKDGEPPLLTAQAGAGESLTQSARETLRRVDAIVDENRKPLQSAIAGIATFADMLGRNSERVEEVLSGLEKMLGGGGPKVPPKVYDLAAPTTFPTFEKTLEGQLAVSDPSAVLVFDTQRVLVRAADGTYSNVENAQWADNLPKLLQAKIVQSFENAKQLRSVSGRIDDLNADYKLATEIRHFEIALDPTPTAVVEIAARLVNADGKVSDARMFKATAPAKSDKVADALPALNEAFSRAATDLVVWTVNTAPSP